MIKPIIASALAVIASAAPTIASTFENHKVLWGTLQNAGVSTFINPAECWDKENTNVAGWYEGAIKHLVICQDNKDEVATEAAWTANDLDTLRHEAQHFIQDCMVGDNHDHQLGAVYNNPIRLAHKILGTDGVGAVINGYSEQGDHVILLELEAFAVATMNDPLEQTRDIQKFCF